ncbi:MAG: hypothetical protein KA354_14310 [Phycisphaerae bacterium]|nr:hypothetical protein [Phycisphaerae bacterium]
MDWDKTINSVSEVARKTFVLAVSIIMVMASFGLVYIAGIALLWLVKHAQAILGQ